MIKLIISLSLIMVLVVSLVSAQSEEDLVLEQEAGQVLPGSFLYPFDVIFDNLRVALSPPGIAKARLRLEIARERLAEVSKLAREDKGELAQVAINDYSLHLSRAGEERGLTDVEQLDIQERITRHKLVLQGVLERVPEQAKPAIQNVLIITDRNIQKVTEQIHPDRRVDVKDVEDKIRRDTSDNLVDIYAKPGGRR